MYRWDFKRFLNIAMEEDDLTVSGSWFHSRADAAEKDLSPQRVDVLGSCSFMSSLERSPVYAGVYG